jgi:hypothetical protein
MLQRSKEVLGDLAASEDTQVRHVYSREEFARAPAVAARISNISVAAARVRCIVPTFPEFIRDGYYLNPALRSKRADSTTDLLITSELLNSPESNARCLSLLLASQHSIRRHSLKAHILRAVH